jgi:hypothetical protein|tara:strand:- start:76 stop:963 length:888 start_codon:yes stop_codon:yes gene_type:complete
MSNQITTAFVQQYKANVEFLLQQKGSVMRPYVRNETQNAEFQFYDRIGATAAVEVLTRHADTPLIETPHDRRRCHLRDFDWADLIDRKDRIRLLIDPTSPYAQNAAFALGRSLDDVIIENMFGTAYTGKTGSTSTTFPSGQVIAVDYVESGSAVDSGLTVPKLRNARQKLIASQNDKSEPRYIAISAVQMTDLLANSLIQDVDTNEIKALVHGEVPYYMGFRFIECERLLATSSTAHRRLPCWVHSGMLLAMGAEIQAEIGPRRDKRNSTQVYSAASFGAVRMEEEKMIEIICDE